MTGTYVVLPADVDDAEVPSGGNVYDRRVCDGLAPVVEVPARGTWPRPAAADRAALDAALGGIPDGAAVLVDGLVACGVPEVVVPHARRLGIVVLVHLPLGAEAADLAARERATLHAARAVVATSAWTAARLVADHGLAPDRVHVAAPGVDAAPLAPGTDGAARLLCLGSVTPTKGQDLLVEALATLPGEPSPPASRAPGARESRARCSRVARSALASRALGARESPVPRWTCDLVGPLRRDPEHVAAVGAAVARHGLVGRVRLTGPRTGAALAATFAATDLLVLPSRVEAYGMVATEALARGIPVLAADAGGVREALGVPVPGLLVPPGDLDALAAALRRWLREPGLRADLRATARTRRGTLDGWEVTTRCLARLLDRVPA